MPGTSFWNHCDVGVDWGIWCDASALAPFLNPDLGAHPARRTLFFPFGLGWFRLAQQVKNEFSAVGDTQFFKYAREVILYRVLAQAELLGNFTIRQSSSHKA